MTCENCDGHADQHGNAWCPICHPQKEPVIDWRERALAAEAKLERVVKRVKALKQQHRPACFVKYSGCVCDVDMNRERALDTAVAAIINEVTP